MLIQHNQLRECRKRSHLTQGDIAYILGLAHPANVSRFEQSKRTPNIEILIAYHLLFNLPVDSFFERHKSQFFSVITKRLQELITKIRGEAVQAENHCRLAFLNEALTRLSEPAKV